MSDGAPFEPRPPATPARRRWRLVVRVGFAVLSAVVVWHYATLEAVKHGDGWEYAYQLESLSRHGTPELRDEDLAAANARFTPASWKSPPAHPYGYFPAPDGRMYGMHFWGYALSAVPARAALRFVGGDELAALQVTNAGWFLLGLGAILFGYPGSVWKRLALGGLVCATPAVWYIRWTGAEVFSWSLAVTAVV
ncbi:MAG TPA: hypothetical protein VKE74_27820, partial [Gemmataceae bacterium]|nr:hypothetical protein [Gemmataceae bacterium]